MRIFVFLVLAFILFNCTLTKRKYLKGWHIEKLSRKKTADSQRNTNIIEFKSARHNSMQTIEKTETESTLNRNSEIKPMNSTYTCQSTGKPFPAKFFLKKPIGARAALKVDGPEENNHTAVEPEVLENRMQLLLVYSLFLIGITLLSLVFVSLINAWGVALALAVGGAISFIVSVGMSADRVKEIREKKMLLKTWPYKLIIAFGIVVLSSLFTLVFAVLLALVVSTSPALLVPASLIFFVLFTIISLLVLLSE